MDEDQGKKFFEMMMRIGTALVRFGVIGGMIGIILWYFIRTDKKENIISNVENETKFVQPNWANEVPKMEFTK